MTAGIGKRPEHAAEHNEEEEDRELAHEAADEILTPAMPPAGAGLMLDVDPRLNQPSETESELERLVESNEDAEEGASSPDKD